MLTAIRMAFLVAITVAAWAVIIAPFILRGTPPP